MSSNVMNNLTTRNQMMLVRMSLRCWSNARVDKTATHTVHHSHGTKDVGRYRKHLVAPNALKPIVFAINDAKALYYARTLPWVDQGPRVVPIDRYMDLRMDLDKKITAYDEAVRTFINDYPDHVEHARVYSHGTLFNADEYPTVEALRTQFGHTITAMPLPSGEDFRTDLDPLSASVVRADIERGLKQGLACATAGLLERALDAVDAMADRLSDPQAIFRDSLVGNITQALKDLETLDPTGGTDDRINFLKDRLRALARYDPETLRHNNYERSNTATNARETRSVMQSWK